MFLKRTDLPTEHDILVKQLAEKRRLPVGMTEFETWTDRIISGAGLPATRESQQWTLAMMMASLPATVAFESDGYFINCLVKAANSHVCQAVLEKISNAKKERERIASLPVPADEDPQPSDNVRL